MSDNAPAPVSQDAAQASAVTPAHTCSGADAPSAGGSPQRDERSTASAADSEKLNERTPQATSPALSVATTVPFNSPSDAFQLTPKDIAVSPTDAFADTTTPGASSPAQRSCSACPGAQPLRSIAQACVEQCAPQSGSLCAPEDAPGTLQATLLVPPVDIKKAGAKGTAATTLLPPATGTPVAIAPVDTVGAGSNPVGPTNVPLDTASEPVDTALASMDTAPLDTPSKTTPRISPTPRALLRKLQADTAEVEKRVLGITCLFKDISNLKDDSPCAKRCSSAAEAAAAQTATSGQTGFISIGSGARGAAPMHTPEPAVRTSAELHQAHASCTGMGNAISGHFGSALTDGPATHAATPTAGSAGLPMRTPQLSLASKPPLPRTQASAFAFPV